MSVVNENLTYCPICSGEMKDKYHIIHKLGIVLVDITAEGMPDTRVSTVNLHCKQKDKACSTGEIDLVAETKEPCPECGSHLVDCITMDDHECKSCGHKRGSVWNVVEEELEDSEYFCPYCQENLKEPKGQESPLFCRKCRNIVSVEEEDWYDGIFDDEDECYD